MFLIRTLPPRGIRGLTYIFGVFLENWCLSLGLFGRRCLSSNLENRSCVLLMSVIFSRKSDANGTL